MQQLYIYINISYHIQQWHLQNVDSCGFEWKDMSDKNADKSRKKTDRLHHQAILVDLLSLDCYVDKPSRIYQFMPNSNSILIQYATYTVVSWLYCAAPVYPSCLHTVLAAVKLNRSSHTVPHCPLQYTSTRPWLVYSALDRRICRSYGLFQILVDTACTHTHMSHNGH